jgi:microcystin-dependent protein
MTRGTSLRFVWIGALALLGASIAAAPARAQRVVTVYVGQVEFMGTYSCPEGWLPADGRTLPINGSDAQFRVIGTTYGGDGRTNFALPKVAMPTENGAMLKMCVAVAGSYPPPPGGIPSVFPYLGQVEFTAASFCPGGWLPADGRKLPISQNDNLFRLIGTTYGGDGKTDFALPKVAMPTANGATLTACVPVIGNAPAPPPAKADASIFLYLGQVEFLATNFCPEGWLPADGRPLQIVQYQTLFSAMGTTYGGNGTTNFALPKVTMRTASGGAMLTACVVTVGKFQYQPR